MELITIDTIGPIDEDFGLKYIIVIIDTFTRYVELFTKYKVASMVAADVLWQHTCRFTAPLQIVAHIFEITGIKYHMTISYSKEEIGFVERANKEVKRRICNILFDKNVITNWSKMLCMTET